jgi:predicted Ser/Thr protein kinase
MADPNETVDQRRSINPHEQETVPPQPDSAAAVASILDRYMAALAAGEAPDREQLLAEHRELAAQLEACLAGIEFVHRATGPTAEEPAVLGEFRIIREIGRGGMGVVYEAEQTSLRRHVALKVLRFGVVADEEAMKRFRREAETVASLHHTNIVPIFAIGCERGVHYYAMQFIGGRSLAEVLAESERKGRPLPLEQVTRWGMQAAEALAHAHERGVIHRDVKPSNLLVDSNGVIWLTDFGLAKRADEATLTASGAFVGTPRYMSPEQAAALKLPVDRRTDVYSLGATLYELATGRPVFDNGPPHQVIAQILTDEPARPRQLRPDLPRDLETIVLACLAKEPSRRYQTAEALAGDLRAVLEARPIQVRRTPAIERLAQYLRKRQRAIRVATLAIVATLLTLVAGFAGWRAYSEWRVGRIELTNEGPPLTAQLLAESGDVPLGEPFEIVERSTLALPAGEYRLRLSAKGQRGRTYRFAVNQGESVTNPISLNDGRLLVGNLAAMGGGTWERPREEAIAFPLLLGTVARADGRLDFVEWTGAALQKRDGLTGKLIWDAVKPAHPRAGDRDPTPRLQKLTAGTVYGRFIQPAPDVDRDGMGDLVWSARITDTIVAFSGRDGSFLWSYSARPDAADQTRGAANEPTGSKAPESRQCIVQFLTALADADRDGITDFVATAIFYETNDEMQRRLPREARNRFPFVRRELLALSGRSGRLLWRYPLDETFANLPASAWRTPPEMVGRRALRLGLANGDKWLALDLASGRPSAGPCDLGFDPVRPVQYAELDGEGEPEILALGPGPAGKQQTLAAFSSSSGQCLWTTVMRAPFALPIDNVTAPDWPLVVDLDGDGRSEILVPDSGSLPPADTYRGVQLVDGRTGQTSWTHALRHGSKAFDGLVHAKDVGDLDHDGVRDLVAVSICEGRPAARTWPAAPAEPDRIHVDALSGKDGRTLWWWGIDMPTEGVFTRIWRPHLWGSGPDGWPLLAITLGGKEPGSLESSLPSSKLPPPVVHLLELSMGRELDPITGFSRPQTGDLDGDGLDDLWGEWNGQLRAFRGETPESWRSLDLFGPAADFDVDGITDVLIAGPTASGGSAPEITGSRTALARSGRDGHLLWKVDVDWREDRFEPDRGQSYALETFPLPAGDLSGDGIADVLAVKSIRETTGHTSKRAATLPLRLYSGRDGHELWTAGPLPTTIEAHGFAFPHWVVAQIVEPGQQPDLIVSYANPFTEPGPPADPRERPKLTYLARVSGRDGRVLWDTRLDDHHELNQEWLYMRPPALVDVDGDHALDTVMVIPGSFGPSGRPTKLIAVSLRTGKQIWAKPPEIAGPEVLYRFVGDLDGDKLPEVIVVSEKQQGDDVVALVEAFRGVDGRSFETWNSGPEIRRNRPSPLAVMADLDGNGTGHVCVAFREPEGKWRVVVLDANGREAIRRDFGDENGRSLYAGDLDGDGRDELLLGSVNRLTALDRDLKERWSWAGEGSAGIKVMPRKSGQPATVLVEPATGLDGATGRPRWAALRRAEDSWETGHATFLDAGTASLLPRVLHRGRDAVVCRAVQSLDPDGRPAPLEGERVPTGLARHDPRWTRPLPWTQWVDARTGALSVGSLTALALINLLLPLWIVRLAGRRRVWSVRTLLALPVATAVPLAVFLAVEAYLPVLPNPMPQSSKAVFALGTLAGAPILVYTAMVLWSFWRLQLRRLGMIGALTIIASILIGVPWLWLDARSKPALDGYGWSGWYMILGLGAYVVGVLGAAAWAVRGLARSIRMVRRG